MSRVWLAGLLAGVAGCHSAGWVKPGGTQDEFAKVRYECLQRSAIPPTYNPTTGTTETTNGALFNACMGARGWHWQ